MVVEEFTSTPPLVFQTTPQQTKGILFFQDSLPLPVRPSPLSLQGINFTTTISTQVEKLRHSFTHVIADKLHLEGPLANTMGSIELIKTGRDHILSDNIFNRDKNTLNDLGVPVTFDATIQQQHLLTPYAAAFKQQISPNKLLQLRQKQSKTALAPRKLPYEKRKNGKNSPLSYRGLTTKSAQFLHKIGSFLSGILRGSTT